MRCCHIFHFRFSMLIIIWHESWELSCFHTLPLRWHLPSPLPLYTLLMTFAFPFFAASIRLSSGFSFHAFHERCRKRFHIFIFRRLSFFRFHILRLSMPFFSFEFDTDDDAADDFHWCHYFLSLFIIYRSTPSYTYIFMPRLHYTLSSSFHFLRLIIINIIDIRHIMMRTRTVAMPFSLIYYAIIARFSLELQEALTYYCDAPPFSPPSSSAFRRLHLFGIHAADDIHWWLSPRITYIYFSPLQLFDALLIIIILMRLFDIFMSCFSLRFSFLFLDKIISLYTIIFFIIAAFIFFISPFPSAQIFRFSDAIFLLSFHWYFFPFHLFHFFRHIISADIIREMILERRFSLVGFLSSRLFFCLQLFFLFTLYFSTLYYFSQRDVDIYARWPCHILFSSSAT